MGFKLTKQQIGEWDEHQRKIRDAAALLSQSIDSFNDAVRLGHSALQSFADDYNKTVESAKKFIHQVGEDWQGEWEGKSEAWREGDKGQEIIEVIQNMSSYSPEEYELESIDEITPPDVNEAEEMENLKPEN